MFKQLSSFFRQGNQTCVIKPKPSKILDRVITYTYDIYMFIWDESKNQTNIKKHGISFEEAKDAFLDPKRLILDDDEHSQKEKRSFCIGKTKLGIITVRFVVRGKLIRIIGAGVWRKGRKLYESKN